MSLHDCKVEVDDEIRFIKTEPIDDIDQDAVELCVGETRGPFLIKKLAADDQDPFTFVMNDHKGKVHIFNVLQEKDPLLLRLTSSPNPQVANCVIFMHSDQMINIMATTDIKASDVLLGLLVGEEKEDRNQPEKRFTCDKCHIAKFSNLEILEVHKRQYCNSNNARIKQPLSGPLTPPPRPLKRSRPSPEVNEGEESVLGSFDLAAKTNHVILLPVAYHDLPQKNAVQMIGPPQTIIPIAVRRPSPSTPSTSIGNPIFIHEDAARAYEVPKSVKFDLPNSELVLPVMKLPTIVRHQQPSTSFPIHRATPDEEEPRLIPEVAKPFLCPCGVSFKAQATLDAHKAQYCPEMRRQRKESEQLRPEPTTSSQRSSSTDSDPDKNLEHGNKFPVQFTIPNQSSVKSFICKICNYRGYSFRGIKHHMRSHQDLDDLAIEKILAEYVTKVPTDEPDKNNDNDSLKTE